MLKDIVKDLKKYLRKKVKSIEFRKRTQKFSDDCYDLIINGKNHIILYFNGNNLIVNKNNSKYAINTYNLFYDEVLDELKKLL